MKKKFCHLWLRVDYQENAQARIYVEMNLVVPWVQMVALIKPHAPSGKTGVTPFEADTMLRIHFMQ